VTEYFANRAPALFAMQACGSAHYSGRKLAALGHEVKLIAAQFVRPFVKSNKIAINLRQNPPGRPQQTDHATWRSSWG
jgi:transposase